MNSRKRLFRERIFNKVFNAFSLTIDRDNLIEYLTIPIVVKRSNKRVFFHKINVDNLPSEYKLESIIGHALDEFYEQWKVDKSISVLRVIIITKHDTDRMAETPEIDLEHLRK